jgi:hypothetical protein
MEEDYRKLPFLSLRDSSNDQPVAATDARGAWGLHQQHSELQCLNHSSLFDF